MTPEIARIQEAVNSAHKSLVVQTLNTSGPRVRSGLSTGSACLNNALSGSPHIGFAWGRIVEIYGPEQSGKTTYTLHLIREAQRLGVPCAFIDAEHALDPEYAKAIGIDLESLLVSQPDCGEQAIELARSFITEGVKLIIVDSVAALTPLAELEGNTGDAFMGKHARLMGQAMRQLTGKVKKSESIIVFINQIRMKIGVMFGNPETTTGGHALKFFASYRMEVRAPRGGAIKEKTLEGQEETGTTSKIKIVKNKVYPPFKSTEIKIRYGVGIDKAEDISSFIILKFGGTSGRVKIGSKSFTRKQLASSLRNKNNKNLRKHIRIMLKSLDPSSEDSQEVSDDSDS